MAVRYVSTIHHNEVTESVERWDNHPAYDTHEKRYRIISATTGEILDDAQGYGYRSPEKAYASYIYNKKNPEIILGAFLLGGRKINEFLTPPA